MKTYHITGLAIRGYFETGKWWKPKKNEILKCIFKEGKVTVIKGKVNCGSVPKEIQEESRMFIKAGGNIEAKVIDKNPRHRGKGEEIPCIYIWSGLNTQLIKDAVKEAKKAVAKARKEAKDVKIQFEEQKIPPKEKPGTSSQNMTDNDTSGPSKSSKKQKEKPGTSSENQNMIDSSEPPKSSKKQNEKPGTSSQMMTDSDTSGSAKSGKQNEKVEGSHKRQSVEFGKDSPNEKVARMEEVTKPKKTSVKKSKSDSMPKNKKDKELPQATVSDSKRVVQDMTDQLQKGEGMPTSTVTSNSVKNQQTIEKKILLSSKNFVKLAQCINKNWELLGLELGLHESEIWKIKEEQNSLELRIFHMFEKWNQNTDQSAYLHTLQRAIKECPKVGYQQPEFKNVILKITQEYKAQLPPGTSSQMMTDSDTSGFAKSGKQNEKVKGSRKRQSVEFGKDSPNGKVARMEEVTKPKKTSVKKSKSDTMLKNKKDKELPQATVSDSKVEGSHKKQSVEFGKDSPNGKVAQMEEVTKPKKTLKKSKSDTMLKNKKDKELPQARVSDSKRVVQDMTDQLQKGEGTTPVKPLCQSADKKTSSTKSASSSKTPNSGNKITNYFTPKSSQSVESVVENVKEINSVRKKILQKEDAKGDNVEEQNKDDISCEKDDMNGDLYSKKSFGQLIDVHGQVETVLDVRTKSEASKSVCKIVQGNYTATGFRVGSRYIMTAAHVTEKFQQGLKFEIQTYAVFNYIKDGIWEEGDKFFFKEVVYTDAELDISVIELIESSHPFPPPFTAFDQPSLDSCFHLIGHSQGNVMIIDPVTKIININNPGVRDKLEQLQKLSYEYTGKSYEDLPHNTLDNPHRFLFQCKFTQGGSGSPGVVLIDEKVIVTTVLLYGYPDWYYNQSMESYKMNWPLDYCIEQGVNMMSVRKKMLQTNLALCINIFGQTLQQ